MGGMVMAAKLKRGACVFFAAVFLVMTPSRSHGAATVAVTVGGYAIEHVLAACGILLGTGAVVVLIGSWDDADTYYALGAAKKLGSYAQRVYDRARDTAREDMEKYQEIETALIALVTSGWGEAVSGIRPLVEDLKLYTKQIYGYGYSGQFWHVPAVPADQIWNVTEWSSLDFFPLPSSPAVLVPPVANNPNYTLFLTCYCKSSYKDTMNIQNWYFLNSADIFGVYDPVNRVLTTYQRDAANSSYALYSGTAYSAYVLEDGTLKYNVSSTSWWNRSTVLCDPADAGSLPFPVFGNMADAEAYVATGDAVNTYVSGTIPMQVDAFREDIAALDTGAVSDVLTLPLTEDAAAENIAALESVYPDAAAADLGQVLTDNGIAVTVTDVTDIPDESVGAGDQSILDSIGAIPDRIADVLNDALTIDSAEAEKKLSLPTMVMDKFPFCIPFDFIHLIGALATEKEVPRFEIPLKFDYQDFHYEQVFIVDMSLFDPVIMILRVMLDLLFCAGLIAVTRNLIRG